MENEVKSAVQTALEKVEVTPEAAAEMTEKKVEEVVAGPTPPDGGVSIEQINAIISALQDNVNLLTAEKIKLQADMKLAAMKITALSEALQAHTQNGVAKKED